MEHTTTHELWLNDYDGLVDTGGMSVVVRRDEAEFTFAREDRTDGVCYSFNREELVALRKLVTKALSLMA